MKPLLFEKGNNNTFRISIIEFPLVAGQGESEPEALEDFLDEFEYWAVAEPDIFEKWFTQHRKELANWTESNKNLYVEVDRPFELDNFR